MQACTETDERGRDYILCLWTESNRINTKYTVKTKALNELSLVHTVQFILSDCCFSEHVIMKSWHKNKDSLFKTTIVLSDYDIDLGFFDTIGRVSNNQSVSFLVLHWCCWSSDTARVFYRLQELCTYKYKLLPL